MGLNAGQVTADGQPALCRQESRASGPPDPSVMTMHEALPIIGPPGPNQPGGAVGLRSATKRARCTVTNADAAPANPLPAGCALAASPAILPPSPFTFPQPPRNTPRGGVTLRPFAKTGVSHRRNTDVIPT